MARDFDFGRILDGNKDALERSYQRFSGLPVDQDWSNDSAGPSHDRLLTIANPVAVSAPGTFAKDEIRTLKLEPTDKP